MTARRVQGLQAGNMQVVQALLARTTEWHQQYREITENAIQAITEGPGEGTVLWTVADDHLAEGVRKLTCVDTGQGMTGPDMVRLLNTLAESGRDQGPGHNHGVGAKITMMAKNPAGVEVRSWRDGRGHRVLLTPDGIVELRAGLAAPHCYFEPIDETSKASQIGEHGTMVVLRGRTDDDDTTIVPAEARSDGYAENGKWLARYLNSKYTRIPDGVTVAVRERHGPRTGSGDVRPILGAHTLLDRVSLDRGVVETEGARVSWWLLAERESDATDLKRANAAPYGLVDAHVALLSGRETYGTRTRGEGRSLLREAGLLYGSGRVALHVEPDAGTWLANAERTRLYDDHGEEFDPRPSLRAFSERLPEALAAFVEEEARRDEARFDPNEAIGRRLNGHADFLRMLHRPLSAPEKRPGGHEQDDDNPGPLDAPGGGPTRRTRRGPTRAPGDPAHRARGTTGTRRRTAQPPARPLDDVPEVVIEDDRSYGAIASYDPAHNELLFNSGSEPVRRVVDRLTRDCAREHGVGTTGRRREQIERKVRAVVVEALSAGVVETVLNTRGTAQSLGWDDEQVGRALSDEALSAAALQVTNKMQHIQAALTTAFGRGV